MSELESGPTSPVDTPALPLAGTSTEATQADAPETLSLDEARKLRSEAANLRRRKNELEARVRQYEESGLSELDKAQREITALREQVAAADRLKRERAVERLVKDALYPDLLLGQLDLSELELDDDGNVRRGDALVAKLQRQYPALWQRPTGSGDGGAGGPPPASADMNQWIRRQFGR